ncbi:MAG: type II toxin-antitoxin system PemK/MazF family toxin [Ignavibacteriales bacterium]|nr:type II toxin-antitoxin system PemK/MazF family toxin [Ignavibacteriales bacterium]
MIRRGEIYWVDLEPVRGSEMKKVRPAVIVSNNLINEHASVIIICPITEALGKTSPIHIPILKSEANLEKESIIHCGQVRAIDKERIFTLIGKISGNKMREIEKGLRLAMVL